MIIPSGINHLKFLASAKLKGVKIQSRYIGVYMHVNTNGSPSWEARYQQAGKNLFRSRFPFTEEGELLASKAYENYLCNNNIKKRRRTRNITEPSRIAPRTLK